MKCGHLRVEQLETRYAPATLVNANTVTFTDPQGDFVTVKISAPVFEQATINTVFTFSNGSVDGDNNDPQDINLLDLQSLAASGATLTINAAKRPGGNGLTDILEIDATGLDLASVTVDGHLRQISAGDADLSTPGLGRLKCLSLSRGSGTLNSIQGDLTRLQANQLGGFLDVNGSIGTIKVEDIDGSGADDSGHIRSAGNIDSVFVSRNLNGANGAKRSGFIEAAGDIGRVSVGNFVRGSQDDSGVIRAGLDIGVITIGGDLAVNSSVGANAARIEAGISIGKVRIGGTVQGSFGPNSGTISAGGDVEAITIGGDLLGAQGTDSGSIISTNGRIGKLTIGGSVNSGAGLRSGSIRAAEDLGSLKISGDVIGTAAQPVRISAAGQEAPATTDLAIGKMTILGRVEFAQIVAGVGILGNPVNVDAQIGNVKVGGDWIASDLTAGVDAGGDGVFGTPDDELIVEAGGGDPNIKARIGKVVIAGSADGTAGGGDHFGIVAQEVGFLSINGELVFVDEGGLTGSALGTTGDFAFHEIA